MFTIYVDSIYCSNSPVAWMKLANGEHFLSTRSLPNAKWSLGKKFPMNIYVMLESKDFERNTIKI